MNGQPHGKVATSAGWPDLVAELDRWGESGRTARLWWRDDDAIDATPQLDRLLTLAGDVPLALAVIPAAARETLASALAAAPQVAVLQHGWRHANHAVEGKKSEYPDGRATAAVGAELADGRARLAALFGPRALPVLVPPWNRFAERFLPLLPELGIAGLSVIAARRPAGLPPGLAAIDVDVDLVAWRGDRGFIGEAAALAGLLCQLRARRCGIAVAAAERPVGILTHHLLMDGAGAHFLERLVALTAGHRAVGWAAAGDLL